MEVHSLKCPKCGSDLVSTAVGNPPSCPRCRAEGPTRTEFSPPEVGGLGTLTGPSPAHSGLRPALEPDELGRLGNYRVLSLLGAGGMGAVYKSEDVDLRRMVALKVMLPQAAESPVARGRFLREARAAAKVEHDHVIPIHQVGEDNGTAYLAMPLLKGETLASRLKREGPLPSIEAMRIAREVALGLAAAQAEGLIHRDIKPANIWLEGTTRRVKILDFGLARPVEEGDPDAHLTDSGAVLGTPAYMSPEQGRNEALDHRSDLFSLGTVMYQMTTGKLPFTGKSVMAILTSLAVDTPSPVEAINPAIPHELSEYIGRLMNKNRDGRPSSADHVARKLGSILMQSMATPIVSDPFTIMDDEPGDELPHAKRKRPIARKSRAGWIWGIAGSLVLLAMAVLAVQILSLTKARGTLAIESDNPEIAVIVRDSESKIVSQGKEREFELETGNYFLELAEPRKGARLSPETVDIEEGERAIVRILVEKPPIPQLPPLPPPPTGKQNGSAIRLAVEGLGPTTHLLSGPTSNAWQIKGESTRIIGRGYASFPKLDATRFVLEADIVVRGNGEATLSLGDVSEFHPELRLWRRVGEKLPIASLIRRRNRAYFTQGEAQISTDGDRLSIRMIVDSKGTVLMNGDEFVSLTPANASALVRLGGLSNETELIVSKLKLRIPTAVETELFNRRFAGALPKEQENKEPDPFAPVTPDIPDYRLAHGLDENGLSKWAENLPPGHRPAWLSWRVGSDPPLFDAISTASFSKADWHLSLNNVTDREVDFAEMGKTHRLAFAVDYLLEKERKSAYLWVKDDIGWFGWRGEQQTIQAKLVEMHKQGYRPASITGEVDSGVPTTSLTVYRSNGLSWAGKLNLTAEELQNELALYKRLNSWPEFVSVVIRGKDVRYNATFSPNVLRAPWEFQTGLKEADLEKACEARKKLNQYPRSIISKSVDGTTEYEVLWLGMAPLPPIIEEERKFISLKSGSPISVSMAPDGKSMAVGTSDGRTYLFDPASGEELHRFDRHTKRVLSVTYSKDGKKLATGSEDGMIRVWDMATKKLLGDFGPNPEPNWDVAITPNNRAVFGSGGSNLWDISNKKAVNRYVMKGCNAVVFPTDVEILMGAFRAKRTSKFSSRNGLPILSFADVPGSVRDLALSPDGNQFAIAISDGRNEGPPPPNVEFLTHICSLETGRILQTLQGHRHIVFSVAYMPHDNMVVTGSLDRTVRLWDAGTGRTLLVFSGHTGFVWGVACTPDGKSIISVGDDGIRIWNVPQAQKE